MGKILIKIRQCYRNKVLAVVGGWLLHIDVAITAYDATKLPTIATISLGQHCVISFNHDSRQIGSRRAS